MKKQLSNIANTKQNLVNAFWELYQQKRIEKITVKDIASVAGYNRSTFYEYFTDIYDVLNSLEHSLIHYFEEHVGKGLDIFNNEEVIKRIIHFFEEKGDYICFLLSDKGDPSFYKKIKSKLKPILFTTLPIKESDPYAEYLFEYVMSATIGTITHWYESGKDIPLSDLITFIRSIHANGSVSFIEHHLFKKGSFDKLTDV